MMDLSKLELKELQALAYEQIVLLRQTERNIQILEGEINSRKNTPKEKGKK